MKILLPVSSPEKNIENKVGGLFETKYACIYDSEESSYEWIPLSSISKKDGNLSVGLKIKGITTVICSSIPLLALELFAVSGFKLYKASGISISENIAFYKNGILDTLREQNAMEETCSSACSSCSSSCG
jgi:predicted Fe-Mo cluster-binding NifX family protein